MFTKEDAAVLDRILEARRTCRAFSDEVPGKEQIEAIIHAGIISPYASIDSKSVVPFRHIFVLLKGDPRMETIHRLCKEQSAKDLEAFQKEQETDPFLSQNGGGLQKLWGNVAQNGLPVFPDPPCLLILAEWRGARRAERQSLAHMVQNMWLESTALNLDFGIISVIESMVSNQEFCDLFGLPAGRYGFHGCVIGHRAGETKKASPPTAEVHWL